MSKKKKKTPKNITNNSKKKTTNQPRDPREATPNEILFFKIGMSVIGLAVIVIAIVFIVQYYVNKEADNPFEDYVMITVTELTPLTKYYEDTGNYVDSDTLKNDEFEIINSLYQANEYFYIYFYHSSIINDEIVGAIEDYTGDEGIPTMTLLEDAPDDTYDAFFLLDLDAATNAGLFDNSNFSHLGLDPEAENMLLTFSEDQGFSLTIDIDNILSAIINLQ